MLSSRPLFSKKSFVQFASKLLARVLWVSALLPEKFFLLVFFLLLRAP